MTTTEEEHKPKRQHVRIKERNNCILRVAGLNTSGYEALFVKTLDHSKGGLGINYGGEKLYVGSKLYVYIETLNVSSKQAEVVWLKQLNGDCSAGLRWV